MIAHVAMPGGFEVVLMLVATAVMLAVILLPVYLVVRLATRSRRSPAGDQSS